MPSGNSSPEAKSGRPVKAPPGDLVLQGIALGGGVAGERGNLDSGLLEALGEQTRERSLSELTQSKGTQLFNRNIA